MASPTCNSRPIFNGTVMFFTNLLNAKSKVSSYQNQLQLFVAENVTTYRL